VSARIAWQRAGGQVWRASSGGAVRTVVQVGARKWVALAEGRDSIRGRFRTHAAGKRWAMSVAALMKVTL
jgi:hypothetical protein